ncbi:nuclear transport factor 2 family protein [Aurantiacibacter odishensis]|uniref:nuclear transport factor 2 family protein n=1 Tax=Aurantiacibacter odishensis TaxID=1155476 RepID=UPI000E718D5B
MAACNAADARRQESALAADVDLASIERQRLTAFVEGDWETAYARHAEDFELVNPRGETWTKSQYLDPQRNGDFRYLVFEPVGEFRVQVVGDAGAVRYESDLSVRVGDNVLPTPRTVTPTITSCVTGAGRWCFRRLPKWFSPAARPSRSHPSGSSSSRHSPRSPRRRPRGRCRIA